MLRLGTVADVLVGGSLAGGGGGPAGVDADGVGAELLDIVA